MPKSRTARRFVTPEALNVSPEHLGQPLARPARRVLAIAFDVGLLGLLSSTQHIWEMIGVAVFLSVFILHAEKVVRWKVQALVALTAVIGAVLVMVPDFLKLADVEAVAAAKIDAAELKTQITQILTPVGTRFGLAALYFTFLPRWWDGQTADKWVFGLRAVELTGKRMTLFDWFSRYGGYAAGLATGLIGFAQVLWDPNRQAIQDKIAHTVVIDLRRPQLLVESD